MALLDLVEHPVARLIFAVLTKPEARFLFAPIHPGISCAPTLPPGVHLRRPERLRPTLIQFYKRSSDLADIYAARTAFNGRRFILIVKEGIEGYCSTVLERLDGLWQPISLSDFDDQFGHELSLWTL